MDEYYEQEHQAWLDEQNAVVSFHEIPQSEYFRAPDGVFWVYVSVLRDGGRNGASAGRPECRYDVLVHAL